MKILNICCVLLCAFALTACSAGRRGDAIEQTTAVAIPAEAGRAAAKWDVKTVQVVVPAELSVSEANSYYPRGDIVWRGDPPGDRREQVGKIMFDGISKGLAHLRGPQAVDVRIDVIRFHSVSEKTRATVGGVHNIKFNLTVTDRATRKQIMGPVFFEPDLNAYGGAQAIAAEQRGETQKKRITDHLVRVMQLEFPGNLKIPAVLSSTKAEQAPAKTAIITGDS